MDFQQVLISNTLSLDHRAFVQASRIFRNYSGLLESRPNYGIVNLQQDNDLQPFIDRMQNQTDKYLIMLVVNQNLTPKERDLLLSMKQKTTGLPITIIDFDSLDKVPEQLSEYLNTKDIKPNPPSFEDEWNIISQNIITRIMPNYTSAMILNEQVIINTSMYF